MKHCTVLGAGTMGNGIAHVFATSGWNVSLFDISAPALERALSTISKNLERQVAKGLLSAEEAAASVARIRTFTELAPAVATSSLVVEAATENVDIKLKLFTQLDELCGPDAILASNTSSIAIGPSRQPPSAPKR